MGDCHREPCYEYCYRRLREARLSDGGRRPTERGRRRDAALRPAGRPETGDRRGAASLKLTPSPRQAPAFQLSARRGRISARRKSGKYRYAT